MPLPGNTRWSLPFVLLLTASAVCRGQEQSGPAEADQELTRLIAEAIAHNPDLLEASELAGAAKQRIAPATALPDPMLSVGYENDGVRPSLGVESMTRLQFMAQQALPFPGKLKLSGRIAGVVAEEIGTKMERVRLTVEAAVRRAYADLLVARQNLATVDEQIQTWTDIEEVTRSRYGAGLGNQLDVLRAQSERTRLLQQKVRDDAAERTALTQLSRLLLRPLEPADVVGHRLSQGALSPPPPRDRILELAEEGSPELKEVQLSKERARLSAELARRDLKPDFVASAAYMNRGGLPLMWSLGLGVTVPLWAVQKQRPLIAEAEGRARAAVAAETSIRARLRARTDERLIRLGQLSREATLDAEGVLVQDQLSVDAALANYRTGGIPFVAVLEALSTLYGDRRAATSRLADYLRSEADLHEFSLEGGGTGGMPVAAAASAASPASRM